MQKYIFALAAALLVACPAKAAVLTNTVTNNTAVRTVSTSVELQKTSTDLETRTINPQPEPPKTTDITPVTQDQATQLDSQVPGTSNEGVQNTIDNALQRVMLNPQPEPPAPANLLGDKVEIQNQISGANISNFSQTVKLGGTVEMKNEQTLYSENGKSYELKSMPAVYYQKLTANLEKNGIGEGSVKSLELKTIDNKPVYEIQVSEPVKWFGLFKGNIVTKVTVAADKEQVQAVKRPWYSFLLSVTNLKDTVELLPNLRVAELKITPASYKEGDDIKIEATIINDGPGFAVGGCDVFNGGGLKIASYVDGYFDHWYCMFLFLKPGETTPVFFHWDKVMCNHKFSVKIDTASSMEETDETDNETSIVTNCQ